MHPAAASLTTTLLLLIIRSIMAFFNQTFLLKTSPSTLGSSRRSLAGSHREVPAGSDCYEDEWTIETTTATSTKDILRDIYTKDHTLASRAKDKKLVQKCRHCLACRGIPPLPPGSQPSSLSDKVLDIIAMPRGGHAAPPRCRQVPAVFSEAPVKVRKGPVPTSRWRLDDSLGPETSDLLEKRSTKQLDKLSLPERYTNIASFRISAPSDMCMEKYSFVGTMARASPGPQPVIKAKERLCQHGRYLETVRTTADANGAATDAAADQAAAAVPPKSRSVKASPQTVLASIRSSGTWSTSSSGRFDPHQGRGLAPAGAKAALGKEAPISEKTRKKKKGLDLISAFLHKMIMSKDAKSASRYYYK